ncbi:hypothetical protein [Vibrio vulnificus]|uniref:hypothetical protein n=1 Tax=Vibrio vulnificus TaxID=672 RepID=UPI0032EAE832
MNRLTRLAYYFVLPLSLWMFVFLYDFIYESMILRGLTEAIVWIEQVEKGNYSPLYYHILYNIITNSDYSLLEVSLLISIICIVFLFFYGCNNRKYFLFINYSFLSLLSLALMLSPGRSSITFFLVFFFAVFFCQRNLILSTITLVILFSFHPGTAFLLAAVILAERTDSRIYGRVLGNKEILYNVFCFFALLSALVFVVYTVSGGFYDNTRGYSYTSAFLALFLFLGWFPFVERRLFILFLLSIIVALFLMKINPVYLFRIIIMPSMIILGVFFINRKNYGI